ncbi:LysM peptidoglycan-binding domain-containing protein [Lederbergia wuyishanensis]|uniref:Spore germination protein n=1 Tax=Lederbergia wuyishanensis TaxID=1347903 RepID=A0ABU0DAH4_9BACI|nr:LysM peptidoglycan-binding domain-containing protein [Lederbergia wuyishanensis]MCJ8010086.1 LysM peptidoglycan-binding domain-containing protein [Lederbergia wuyishanensis]MDQ0345325.1 spore germination protein [Lederbergia wuyishanensis]
MIIDVVQKGDTLWSIANRYGSTVQSIATANQLPNPNKLLVGQSLVIPISATQHVVRSGETLWQIAQRYGVPIQSIIQINQLTHPSMINVGIELIIPARTYAVQAGDTLATIAQRFGTTVREIMRANQLTQTTIFIGTRLIIPFSKPVIDVNAYIINMGETGGREVREVGEHLTYMSPFGYIMQADGSLSSIRDEQAIQAAKETNVAPIMCITNFTFQDPGTTLAHTILSNTQLQERLLTNVINIMKAKGYRGLNIDFENVRQTDRELYNQFLQRAVNRLHPLGYFVSTALAPKTSSEQKGLLYEAHDYAAHGRIVDFVVLMTYEWGYRFGPPQAISPLNQIRRVIDYAVTVIPRNKIFMGFQLYARDWLLPHVKGQEAETFDMQEAIRRADKYNATIQYDRISQTPFYRYTDEQGRQHEVWFEDARSAQAKFELVKDYRLRGISYWVLGYPFPQNWLLLENNFIVRKV